MLYRLTIYLFVQKNMFVQPANESPLTAKFIWLKIVNNGVSC